MEKLFQGISLKRNVFEINNATLTCVSIVSFSLYPPDSPIFSSKEYDWDDPVFLENVFETPNLEETFAGKHLDGYPGFTESQKNEGKV